MSSMRIAKTKSLTFRLTVWYIVILGLLVSASGAFLYQGFRTSLLDEMDRSLREIAYRVNSFWQRTRGTSWADAIRRAEEEFRRQEPFILVVELGEDEGARIENVYGSGRFAKDAFLFELETYRGAEDASWDKAPILNWNGRALAGSPLRVVFLPTRGDHIIQVGLSLGYVSGELRRLTLILVLAGLLLLLFASFGGSFIIRKALRPVRSVVETARRISADDLGLRIDAPKRKDEIGELVATINDMIARLDGSVNKIRKFSGDVSHELRTPLTIIRGEIEVALRKERREKEYRATLDSVLEETYHMEKIIEDLLFLSRIEAVRKTRFDQEVPLSDILARVRESRAPAAKTKQVGLEMGACLNLLVLGDRTLLERLVANLVDNAIRYTPSGGRVELSCEDRDGRAALAVRDTGIGIPEESLPFIFDRFYVVDPSRSKESGGSGLGLSIVKSVADIHGAEIQVESQLGAGTVFRIVFP